MLGTNCFKATPCSEGHAYGEYLFACNCYEVGMQWDVHLRDTACGWEPSPPYWCQSLYINIYLCLSRVFVKCDCVWCVCMQHADSKCYERYYYHSARMRSEDYSSCLVCVCVSVCPGLSSATHTTTRPSRHTYGLNIVLAPELIWRFSYNGLVSEIAIAFPYSRAQGSQPFFFSETGSFSAFLPY